MNLVTAWDDKYFILYEFITKLKWSQRLSQSKLEKQLKEMMPENEHEACARAFGEKKEE